MGGRFDSAWSPGLRGHAALLARLVIVACLPLACAKIATAPLQRVHLSGTITTPDGRGVTGATLYFRLLSSSDTGHLVDVVDTDTRGQYAVTVGAGTYRVDIFSPEEAGLPFNVASVVSVDPSRPRFDYAYEGHIVTGAVTGPTGTALPNAFLWFMKADGHFEDRVGARMSATGFEAFLTDGVYRVHVGPSSDIAGIPDIEFNGVDVRADTTLQFALTGRRVTGNAIGPEGEVLPGTTIYFSSYDYTSSSGVNSGADGSYELYVPDGTFRVDAFPGLDHRHIMARTFGFVAVTGDLRHDLRFEGVWWRGTIREADSGTPISGAELTVRRRTTDLSYARAEATTGADGRFAVSLVAGGLYDIAATAPSRESLIIRGVLAGADSTFDLTLEPLGTP